MISLFSGRQFFKWRKISVFRVIVKLMPPYAKMMSFSLIKCSNTADTHDTDDLFKYEKYEIDNYRKIHYFRIAFCKSTIRMR